MRLDLWEFVFHVVRIHGLDLFASGGAKNFDDLDELVNATVSWEKRLAEHKLGHDAARGPYVNVGGIIGRAEDEFGCAVVT